MMNTKKILSTLAAALLLALPHQAAAAIDPASVQKLVAGDGAAGDAFGSSVSLSADGRTALIEASADDSKGSAYVFVKGADGRWSQQAKLTAKDEMAGKRYGTSVTLSADGRTAFIGHTYLLSSGQVPDFHFGSVCVFVKGADGRWSQQAKLTADDNKEGGFSDNMSLSADGSTALIGSSSGWTSSSAYFFVKGADGRWSKQAKLPDVGGGVSLSANGGTALIGTGVFVRGIDGRWSEQARIADGDGYAVSLSADGSTALIGAQPANGLDSGAAYISVKGTDGTWNRKAKLTAADGAAGDYFGDEVSLSADGRIALIGAWGDDDKGKKSGSAYVFAKGADGSWSQQVKLTAADGAAFDRFASALSLSADGSTVLIGAHQDGDKGGDSGSAYVYSSTAAPQSASKPAAVKP